MDDATLNAIRTTIKETVNGKIDHLSEKNVNFVSGAILANALCGIKATMRVTVVNVTSGAADRPIGGWGMYCSTKAATKMFLSVLARQEGTDYRLKVHHFDPGVMDTKMQSRIRKSDTEHSKEGLLDPGTVAKKLIKRYVLKQ